MTIDPTAALAETPPLAGPQDRRPRLLVVDDQPAGVQSLCQVFAADHEVFEAGSAEQAVARCIARRPDLVLLDAERPGIDGYEICRRLKSDEATRDIPVIVVLARADDAAATRALDAGAADFVGRPIHPRVVRARVATHLALKRQSELLRHAVHIDGPTGVCSRRSFDERLQAEWGRAVREGQPLAVLLVEVDDFAACSDRLGQQAGDDALRRVAAALKDALKRPADLVARHVGERFVCLLPDTDFPGALALARSLCERVRAAGIAQAASAAAPLLTVSIGACAKPHDVVGSPAALLREADTQLGLARSRGRDQACGAELDGH